MKFYEVVFAVALVPATFLWVPAALAQGASPTATQPLQLSAFGGVSGVYTGLASGKNLSITAGGDLSLPPLRWVRPAIEVRGTYPIDNGKIDAQRDVLGGLRFEFLLNRRLRPYGDVFFGRGQINYESGGYHFGIYRYALTTTNVEAAGGGVNYDLNRFLGIKVDAQVERWDAPTDSGKIYSKAGTVGVVYTFNFGRRR